MMAPMNVQAEVFYATMEGTRRFLRLHGEYIHRVVLAARKLAVQVA
jgi:hypothetical protein